MNDIDIRWKRRFDNFKRALAQLESAVHLAGERPLLAELKVQMIKHE